MNQQSFLMPYDDVHRKDSLIHPIPASKLNESMMSPTGMEKESKLFNLVFHEDGNEKEMWVVQNKLSKK